MPTTTRTSIVRGRLRRPLFLRRPALPKPDDPLGLFGDGPPWWTINKGKPGQRPSSSAGEAMKQRDATAFRLRWHANHVALLAGNETTTSLAASALADKLDACAPPSRPCLSGACPVCMRAQQRWFAKDTVHVLRPRVRDYGYRAQVLSLESEFGRIPAGSLNAFDIDKFLDDIREALKACGIVHYKLGLDVSLKSTSRGRKPRVLAAPTLGLLSRAEDTLARAAQRTPESERWSDPAGEGREAQLAGGCCRVWREDHFRPSRVLQKSEPESRGSRGVLEHATPSPTR